MPAPVSEQLSRTIETLYRSESGRVLATLVRLLGDLDLAEEAMHEAFAAALESWPQTGIPDKPRPWLISTARFRAIDGMRRRARFEGAQRDLARYIDGNINEARINEASLDEEEIEDDRLRLIFTCCHPALPPEGQVALTLHSFAKDGRRAVCSAGFDFDKISCYKQHRTRPCKKRKDGPPTSLVVRREVKSLGHPPTKRTGEAAHPFGSILLPRVPCPARDFCERARILTS